MMCWVTWQEQTTPKSQQQHPSEIHFVTDRGPPECRPPSPGSGSPLQTQNPRLRPAGALLPTRDPTITNQRAEHWQVTAVTSHISLAEASHTTMHRFPRPEDALPCGARVENRHWRGVPVPAHVHRAGSPNKARMSSGIKFELHPHRCLTRGEGC